MTRFAALVRPVMSWQAAGLAAAAVAVGVGGWLAWRAWGPGAGPAIATDQQIVPVQRGDLVSSVSVNGTLSFPTRETLIFGSAGTVASVAVDAGQIVKAGQELARLDPATITNLEAAVAQGRVNAKNAADALALAQVPDPVKLAQARIDVQNALDALDALTKPTALALAQAESAVASARLAVQNATEVRQDFLDTNSQTELKAVLDSAETSLRNATDSLAVTQANWDSKSPGFRTTRDTTLDAYRGALSKYVGVDISAEASPADPETVLAARGIDLAKAYSGVSTAGFSNGKVVLDDPATPWNELTIYLWKAFFPGAVVATCESAPAQQGTVCVSNELEKTWTQYQAARDNLAAQENQASMAITAAQAAVDKAKDARDLAKSAVLAGPDPIALAVQDQNVAVARARLSDAEQALAKLKSPDAVQVALRRAQLDSARKNLKTLEEGDPVVLDLLRSTLNSANAALETAQARLNGAVMKAPWDGQVATVNISAGQPVSANVAAIELADPTRVQLSGTLDEIDVLYVQPGATAQVTLDALSGQAIRGTVASIAGQGTSQSGVVTFPVTIDVTAPQGVQLREGLSATATIVLNQNSNVLLIPAQAVSGTFAQPVVHVMKGKAVEQQSVTLGESDGFWVAVTEGLEEGDRVVMKGSQTSSSQLNAGAVIRGAGGFGGPGGIGGPTVIFEGPGGNRQFFQQQGQGNQRQGNNQGGQTGQQGGQRGGGQTGGGR